MSNIVLKKQTSASIDTPATDKVTIFVDSADGKLKNKNDTGIIDTVITDNTIDQSAIIITSPYPLWEAVTDITKSCLYLNTTDNKLYLTDASNAAKVNLYGIATALGAIGSYPKIYIDGVVPNFANSDLINYYISWTPGWISSTVWTNAYKIGSWLWNKLMMDYWPYWYNTIWEWVWWDIDTYSSVYKIYPWTLNITLSATWHTSWWATNTTSLYVSYDWINYAVPNWLTVSQLWNNNPPPTSTLSIVTTTSSVIYVKAKFKTVWYNAWASFSIKYWRL